LQAQILKGAEEDQGKWNVVWTATIAIRSCLQWTNSTLEEKLWAHDPQAVWVRKSIFNNVAKLAITTIPNVIWKGWDSC
jgi:hypothetical protein